MKHTAVTTTTPSLSHALGRGGTPHTSSLSVSKKTSLAPAVPCLSFPPEATIALACCRRPTPATGSGALCEKQVKFEEEERVSRFGRPHVFLIAVVVRSAADRRRWVSLLSFSVSLSL